MIENLIMVVWWFLAFNLKDIIKYPFPFFIRGDDLLFSLNNKLNITTLMVFVFGQKIFLLKKIL